MMFVSRLLTRNKYALPWQRRFLASVFDPSMVDDSYAPASFEQLSAVVYPDMITASEHDALVAEIEPLLKRYV